MRIAIIAAAVLILGGCASANQSFIHADHRTPGSEEAKIAWRACKAGDTSSHSKLAPKAELPIIPIPILVPYFEDICDQGCWEARRAQVQCMHKQGWIPCLREALGARWQCDKVPS